MSNQSSVTVVTLAQQKQVGEKIVCLTAYDATFAALMADAGVEVILVGDSLGNVVQGHDSTLPVRIYDMVYHAAAVSRAKPRSLIVVDMPFQSYVTPEQALQQAARLMSRGGAQMVKLEGGKTFAVTIETLVAQGIPVCAHLGLLPQSVHQQGGYHVQGKSADDAATIEEDARIVEASGASMLVLECVPSELAASISQQLTIPVIGIGAGPDCDGQVLVMHDLLGIVAGKRPRFVKNFLAGGGSVQGAFEAYVQAVKDGSFPASEHSFPGS